jgi:hypothetical protein
LPQATLPELVGRLINDVSDLADRQIELARQEIGDAKDEAIGAAIRIGIGAGIAAGAALLLLIWAWTAFIWFFNWLFGLIKFELFGALWSRDWIGWVLGAAAPVLLGFVAWTRFIWPSVMKAKSIWPPLPRTRQTLKEDLEWVQNLRTPSAR